MENKRREGGKTKDPSKKNKTNSLLFVSGPERRSGVAGFRARRRGRRGQGLGRAGQLGERKVGHWNEARGRKVERGCFGKEQGKKKKRRAANEREKNEREKNEREREQRESFFSSQPAFVSLYPLCPLYSPAVSASDPHEREEVSERDSGSQERGKRRGADDGSSAKRAGGIFFPSSSSSLAGGG